MDLQKAGEIIDKLLEDESDANHPKLTAQQFAAINRALLELQADGRYWSEEMKKQNEDIKRER